MNSIVLIVGAGASREFEVPTGRELIEKIVGDIRKNPEYQPGNGQGEYGDLVNQYFVYTGRDPLTEESRSRNRAVFESSIVDFREKLKSWSKSGRSIDVFLIEHEAKEEFKAFGKLAIAYYIMGSEEWLMRENLFAFRENWLRPFLEKYLPHVDDIRENRLKLTIITFNYDRIIEHFLYNFLRHYLNPRLPGWEEKERTDKARELVDKFSILHVYDKLAELDWQNRRPGESIRFGERNNDKERLGNASGRIQLIAEGGMGRVSEERKKEIRLITSGAQKIYFLGFGFDPDNMKLLFGDNRGEEGITIGADCYATAYKLSDEIKNRYRFIKFYNDLTCFSLVKDSSIFDLV
jgi:hypothetical protein